MEEQTRLVRLRCLEILGGDYSEIQEHQHSGTFDYISFKFKPVNKRLSLSSDVTKSCFDQKIEEIRSEYKQHDVYGGKCQYSGYIHIMLNTEDRIREKISIAILEYTEKINHLKAQLATFGN